MHTDIATARLVFWVPAFALTLLACPGPEPEVPEPTLPEPSAEQAGPCDDQNDPNCPRRCADVFPNPEGPVPPKESRCIEER